MTNVLAIVLRSKNDGNYRLAPLDAHDIARLKELGNSRYPDDSITEVWINNDLFNTPEGALIKWTDKFGKRQHGYSKEFISINAQHKWERVLENRYEVAATLAAIKSQAQFSPVHTAALIIAYTGLRPGGFKGLQETGNFGVTTMLRCHLTFVDEKTEILIEYRGKGGKNNQSLIADPFLFSVLKEQTKLHEPKDRVFPYVTSEMISRCLPASVKTKDLRTILAINAAEHILQEYTSIDPTKANVKHIIKDVCNRVSRLLNNTPTMAKTAYIAPTILENWIETLLQRK